MRYLLLRGTSYSRILPVAEENYNNILSLLKRGRQVYEISKPPSRRTLGRWAKSGRCKALCGCWISSESGARCSEHSSMSWLTAVYNLTVDTKRKFFS